MHIITHSVLIHCQLLVPCFYVRHDPYSAVTAKNKTPQVISFKKISSCSSTSKENHEMMGVRQLIRAWFKASWPLKMCQQDHQRRREFWKVQSASIEENCKSHMKTWKRLKKRWGWGIINNNLFLMKGEILSYPSSSKRKLVFFVIQATKLNLLNNMVPKKGILRCIKDRITTCTKEIIKLSYVDL